MPSLIQPYEYDIFISYRHNDNRSGWVSEFVEALQQELATTIKEPISVYFDNNPHDGLLETHNVKKSLDRKLKCLIFIPIISQTYCDTKSFAWQHEFCAFNRLAKEDQFGVEIKLINGNVTSRILPVKIHDLDVEDKRLLEYELGGVLRAIEFIFKSAGVNRPLRANEDHPQDNLNKTYYRDQINKLANAIKQMINVLRNPTPQQTTISDQPSTKETTSNKSIITIALSLLLLAIFGYVIYSKIFSSEEEQKVVDKSIAVLPFTDISDTKDQAYFSEGMMIEILDHLFKIKDLRIIPRNSTLRYKDSTKPLKEIATELGVAHLIQGSVRKAGNKVKISIALVDGNTEESVWHHTYEDDIAVISRVFIIQSDVASQIAGALQAEITPEVQERLKAIPTQNEEAYDLFLKGQKEVSQRWGDKINTAHVLEGIAYFNKAISLDSTFADAFTELGICYWWLAEYAPDYTPEYYRRSREYLNKAIALDPQNGVAYSQLAVNQYHNDWDRKAASQSFQKALELNPSDKTIYGTLFWFYLHLQNCDSMKITLDKLKEIEPLNYYDNEVFIKICKGQDRELQAFKPPENFGYFGSLYIELQRLMILERYEDVFAKMDLYKSLASEQLYLEMKGEVLGMIGKKSEAQEVIQQLDVLSNTEHVWPSRFAVIYMAIGDEKKAYEYLEKGTKYRGLWMHLLPYYAPFYKKRNDPKFKDFMKRTWVN